MAKKKTQKGDSKELGETVDRLLKQVGEDREMLVKFTEELISRYDGEKSVGIAEYVAKLADALTRQHQIKASVVKALSRVPSSDGDEDDLDELHSMIGQPFKGTDVDDGTN